MCFYKYYVFLREVFCTSTRFDLTTPIRRGFKVENDGFSCCEGEVGVERIKNGVVRLEFEIVNKKCMVKTK